MTAASQREATSEIADAIGEVLRQRGLDVAVITSCGVSGATFRDWAEIDHWASQIADGQQAPDMTAEQTP